MFLLVEALPSVPLNGDCFLANVDEVGYPALFLWMKCLRDLTTEVNAVCASFKSLKPTLTGLLALFWMAVAVSAPLISSATICTSLDAP